MSTKKNQKVINYMIDVISDIGFVQDAYGNWKKIGIDINSMLHHTDTKRELTRNQ